MEIELWQVIGVFITILIAVLSVYGALIKENGDSVEENRVNHEELHGRLYGEDRGKSGDVNYIKQKVDTLDEKQSRLCKQTRRNQQTLEGVAFSIEELIHVLGETDEFGEDVDRLDRYHKHVDDEGDE